MKPWVSGVCGTVRMTKSASGRRLSSASGPSSLDTPGGRLAPPRVDADHAHAEGLRQPRRLAADAAHAHDQRGGLGQVHHAGIGRRGPPLAPELERQVVVEPAREREHEGHDVRADVVVVDLAEVGDHHRVRDQLVVIVAGGRRGLRRLEPPEAPGLAEQRRRRGAEGGLGAADLARGVRFVLRDDDGQLGQRRRRTRAAQARVVAVWGGSIRRVVMAPHHTTRGRFGDKPAGALRSKERWRAGSASSAGSPACSRRCWARSPSGRCSASGFPPSSPRPRCATSIRWRSCGPRSRSRSGWPLSSAC